MCGENVVPRALAGVTAGSSPRVRGKRGLKTASRRTGGLIPACAGKTNVQARSGSPCPAHPRVCGENPHASRDCRRIPGSSPRVRGKPDTKYPDSSHTGLIPACAGKTIQTQHTLCCDRAHPRVCGENSRDPSGSCRGVGSSPRVRGKPRCSRVNTVNTGLIPACAGKTTALQMRFLVLWAHPRVCGENSWAARTSVTFAGSSPRVRGKRPGPIQRPHPSGLIPACAGKTLRESRARAARQAHPRVCGENIILTAESQAEAGSSPRVRGKQVRAEAARSFTGLIPACAGKTNVLVLQLSNRRAHPRVCGENTLLAARKTRAQGSSPRVRGKRRRRAPRVAA